MIYDVIVLGSGAIGASIAFELAKDKKRVLVIEKRGFASGASGRSAAMLESQIDAHRGEPFFSLARQSHRLFPGLEFEMKEITGQGFDLEFCGIVQLAFTEQDEIYLKNEIQRQTQLNLKAEWLSPHQTKEFLPNLTTHIRGSAFFKEDGQVDGLKMTQKLIQAAKMKNVTFLENVGSIQLLKEGNAISGVITPQGKFRAESVVLATGAWTDEFLKPLGFSLGIEPLRGQLLLFDTPVRPLPCPIYTPDQGYITPKKDHTLVGSTMEKVGFNEDTTEEAKDKLEQYAKRLCPLLQKAKILTMTAGLRPNSPNKLPFIGPLPSFPNIIVAAGHFRNGILLAPITAKMVSALIQHQTPPVPLSPFLVR